MSHALLAEAHEALDLTSNVLAHGAQIAPDYSMRVVIAMRDRLAAHQPSGGRCLRDGEGWPCLDVRLDLRALGLDLDGESQ